MLSYQIIFFLWILGRLRTHAVTEMPTTYITYLSTGCIIICSLEEWLENTTAALVTLFANQALEASIRSIWQQVNVKGWVAVSQCDQSLHVQPWGDVSFGIGVEINFWVREWTKCSVAALQIFLLYAYLKAQRKLPLLFSWFSCLAAVSVYSFFTFLSFSAELRWSLVWIIQNASTQTTPVSSELKGGNYQDICWFFSPSFLCRCRGDTQRRVSIPPDLWGCSVFSAAPVSLCRTEAELGLLP